MTHFRRCSVTSFLLEKKPPGDISGLVKGRKPIPRDELTKISVSGPCPLAVSLGLGWPVGITQEGSDLDRGWICALFTSGHPSQLRLHPGNLSPGLGSPNKTPTLGFTPAAWDCVALPPWHSPSASARAFLPAPGDWQVPAGIGLTSMGLGELTSIPEPLKALPEVHLYLGDWGVGRLKCKTWMYSSRRTGSACVTLCHGF